MSLLQRFKDFVRFGKSRTDDEEQLSMRLARDSMQGSNTTEAEPQVSIQNIERGLSRELVRDWLAERKTDRRWTMAKRLMWVGMFGLSLLYSVFFMLTNIGFKFVPKSDLVAVVRIEGEISAQGLASADKVIPVLRKAFSKPNVKAIALAIDSPGGAPVEAERITNAIAQLRKQYPKPVYAFINNVGASAAYMVAIEADSIYAAKYSLVGSIGAIMGGWDVHKALQRFDVNYRVYASGPLKSLMDPFNAMTPEATLKASELVGVLGSQFAQQVLTARGDRLVKGFDIATGEVWNGTKAKELGLIDDIGTLEQVVELRHAGVKSFDFGPSRSGLTFSSGLSSVFEDVGRGIGASLVKQRLEVR